MVYMNKIISDLRNYGSPIRIEPTEADLRDLIAVAMPKVEIPSSVKVSVKIDEGATKLVVDPQ